MKERFFSAFIIRGVKAGIRDQGSEIRARGDLLRFGLFKGRCVFIEEGLEDQGGGYLIDDAAVLLAGVAGFIEDLVGFAGGEALVPEVDGEAGELA
jgi:hypothetical protein